MAGLVLMILRRLPEAVQQNAAQTPRPGAREKLLEKGLPAQAISRLRVRLAYWAKKVWHFILEAKDLRPQAAKGYRIRKIFGDRLPGLRKAEPAPLTTQEIRNEQYYLDLIKLQPKNLANYDALGKFYLEQKNVEDAQDLYLYLATHAQANPDYQARLAYCYFYHREYEKAADYYQKSLALDSTQPNRYYNRAIALEALGRFLEAIDSLKKAIDLEGSNSKYQVSLAGIYQKLGRRGEARAILQKVKKLDPENEAVAEKLKML